jgi:DNA oxidative demethylase
MKRSWRASPAWGRHGKGETMALPGFLHLAGHLSAVAQRALVADITQVIAAAPLYTPAMPRSGRPMSVRMTNCGSQGWVTDKARGYRYQELHPETHAPWPAMPSALLDLWSTIGRYAAPPEACLVNFYDSSAKLGLHQDMDEDDKIAPVVSVSLGDDAWFRVGGVKRSDPTERLRLRSGDVVVLGGAARMAFHGVDRTIAGTSDLLAEGGFPAGGRINLTLRRVTAPKG